MKRILLRFRHGLGDALQFTAVLRHLREYRPDSCFDVAALPGKHSVFEGLAERVFLLGSEPGDYEQIVDVVWAENRADYENIPTTKTSRSLKVEFGIEPKLRLMKYWLRIPLEILESARRYFREIGCAEVDGKFRAVVLHYEGNTARNRKNLDHSTIRGVCKSLLAGGYVPVILDWDRRSPLPDGTSIFCPNAQHWLWQSKGTGNAAQIAALLELCMAFVGIDSGPLHVGAAVSTLGIGVWTQHLPIQYIEPAGNIRHLIPANWRKMRPCINPTIANNQARWYSLVEYDSLQDGRAIVEQLTTHCGLNLSYVPWHAALRSTTFDESYYSEHREAGLDYLAYTTWQKAYASWLSRVFGFKGRHLLDVGCACGSIARGFLESGMAVHGVDINDYTIQLGRKKWPELASNLHVADVKRMPMFDDGAFELLHSSQVAEHWHPGDVPAILAELLRITQPDGLFFCSLDTEELYAREQRDIANEDPTHYCVKPMAFWHDALKASGWEVVTSEFQTALWETTGSFLPKYRWDYFVAKKPTRA